MQKILHEIKKELKFEERIKKIKEEEKYIKELK